MSITTRTTTTAGAFAAVLLSAALASASPFAVGVIDYTPGAAPGGYQNPLAALGKTHPFTPAQPQFNEPPYAVTPFNATYDPADLVAIGTGGRLVLQLGQAAATGAGHTLGIHAGVGLIDGDWPNGLIIGPAIPYTSFRSADVRVSADGVEWFTLGSDIAFENPTNWWSAGIVTPGASPTGGTVEADFTQPFLGTLADFDNRDWDGVLDLLAGSAGGTWLDLSAVPLGQVNFIEFSVSQPGMVMYVDAVVAIPEPASGALAALGLCALARRGRGRRGSGCQPLI